MKRFILTLTLLVSLLAAGAQNLVIGTYNIRLFLDSDEQKGEVWRTRCKVMCDQMNFVQPDAFGAQEVLYGQLKDMLRQLDGYDAIGRARDDGQDTGEFSPIFIPSPQSIAVKSTGPDQSQAAFTVLLSFR